MSKEMTVKEGNRIEKINNAKYMVFINDKAYPIFFTFGLKQEIFGIISDAYVKTLGAFDNTTDRVTSEIIKASESLSKLEGKEKEDAINNVANSLAEKGVKTNIKRDLEMLKDYEDMSYIIVSKMLTQRDDEGKPIEEVTVDKILYSKDFLDTEKIIEELFQLAVDKFQETAKKNTNLVSQAMNIMQDEGKGKKK